MGKFTKKANFYSAFTAIIKKEQLFYLETGVSQGHLHVLNATTNKQAH